MPERPGTLPGHGDPLPALWCANFPSGESAALARFVTPVEGALLARAPGLLKAGSKLAPLLQYGDELSISLVRGRGNTPTLTGVTCMHSHPGWRAGLHPLSLLWFMLESAVLTSGAPGSNEATFRLLVNILRSEPSQADLPGALCVYCLKLLALHGLLPDLLNCAETGTPFASSEPVFLLPHGEGLIGREASQSRPSRGASGLRRIEAPQRQLWLALLHGPLLRYGERGATAADAALLLQLAAGQIGSIANQALGSAKNLAQAWQLPPA